MKNLFFLTVIALAACSSCSKNISGSGAILMEDRVVADFRNIDISGIVETRITFGESPKVTVQADDNLIEDLKTMVSGETLYIDFEKEADRYTNTTLKVFVEVPGLKMITNASAAEIVLDGLEDLISLNVEHSGISKMILKGSAQELSLNNTGTGVFEGFNFIVENAEVQQSGIGDVHLSVNAKLTGTLSGTGNIHFKGNPSVDVPVTGFGKLVDAN